MEVYYEIRELQNALDSKRKQSVTIGLVPTMGALHAGHMALISSCKMLCDITVATIFVNPTQFNNLSDLSNYPKSIEKDLSLLESNMCDIVFIPDKMDIYPTDFSLSIDPGFNTEQMEGLYRPGHFNGVGLVIIKLFNIVKPDNAFFGQKDFQQFKIIESINTQLFFDIELIMVPTVRESNGLAMSSRNRHFSPDQLSLASSLSRFLNEAGDQLKQGVDISQIKESFKSNFRSIEDMRLEYFEIINANNLKPIEHVNDGYTLALCAACFIGQVRIIDNIIIQR